MDLAVEKGVSSWLTTLPIEKFVCFFSIQVNSTSLALGYDWLPYLAPLPCTSYLLSDMTGSPIWLPSHAPPTCSCGTKFSIEHSLSCPSSGFTIIRHNEIRDLTATLLTEVCHDVSVEPTLQPITGEEFWEASAVKNEGAQLDIAANCFWGGNFEKTFLDVPEF